MNPNRLEAKVKALKEKITGASTESFTEIRRAIVEDFTEMSDYCESLLQELSDLKKIRRMQKLMRKMGRPDAIL